MGKKHTKKHTKRRIATLSDRRSRRKSTRKFRRDKGNSQNGITQEKFDEFLQKLMEMERKKKIKYEANVKHDFPTASKIRSEWHLLHEIIEMAKLANKAD